jgi:hypothetical protein
MYMQERVTMKRRKGWSHFDRWDELRHLDAKGGLPCVIFPFDFISGYLWDIIIAKMLILQLAGTVDHAHKISPALGINVP